MLAERCVWLWLPPPFPLLRAEALAAVEKARREGLAKGEAAGKEASQAELADVRARVAALEADVATYKARLRDEAAAAEAASQSAAEQVSSGCCMCSGPASHTQSLVPFMHARWPCCSPAHSKTVLESLPSM